MKRYESGSNQPTTTRRTAAALLAGTALLSSCTNQTGGNAAPEYCTDKVLFAPQPDEFGATKFVDNNGNPDIAVPLTYKGKDLALNIDIQNGPKSKQITIGMGEAGDPNSGLSKHWSSLNVEWQEKDDPTMAINALPGFGVDGKPVGSLTFLPDKVGNITNQLTTYKDC